MTVVSALRPPRVFVMAANIDSFGDPRWDWSWAAFAEEPRLSVEQTTHAQSASGSATFRVLRSDQIAPGATGQANLPTALRVGAYVLVTTNTTTNSCEREYGAITTICMRGTTSSNNNRI